MRGDVDSRKLAFTLAEVLITLGIIGVVAAMTIPSLIAKHNRIVVETKLKKFYSTINQAVKLSVAENGTLPDFNENNSMYDSVTGGDKDSSQKLTKDWYDKYIIKYLNGKIVEDTHQATSKGVKVKLPDGTGFASTISYSGQDNGDRTNMLLVFCLKASKCDLNDYDGKNHFLFEYSPEKGQFYTSFVNSPTSINALKNYQNVGCYTNSPNKAYCTRLIEMNGWKIPDDYPWIK